MHGYVQTPSRVRPTNCQDPKRDRHQPNLQQVCEEIERLKEEKQRLQRDVEGLRKENQELRKSMRDNVETQVLNAQTEK